MAITLYVNLNAASPRASLVLSEQNMLAVQCPSLIYGDQPQFEIYFVDGLGNFHESSGADGYSLKIAIGTPGAAPTGGTYSLVFQGEGTSSLDWDATAAEIEAAFDSIQLNAAEVTGEFPAYQVQWSSTGAQDTITGTTTDLTPASGLSVTTLVEGDGSTQEIQLIRLVRSPLTEQSTWAQIEDGWSGVLQLDYAGLASALGGNESVTLTFEIEVTNPDGQRRTVAQVPVILYGDVISNVPVAFSPGDSYYTSAETEARFVRNRSDITGLTGGGATNLDGIVTTSITVGYQVTVRATPGEYIYRLVAGTDAESSPMVIRPDDYGAGTNEKVWKLGAIVATALSLGTSLASQAILAFSNTLEEKILFYQTGGGSDYGITTATGLLAIHAGEAAGRIGLGYDVVNVFTEVLSVIGNRVGINTTAPGYSLHVVGTTYISGAVTLASTLSVTGLTALASTTASNLTTTGAIIAGTYGQFGTFLGVGGSPGYPLHVVHSTTKYDTGDQGAGYFANIEATVAPLFDSDVIYVGNRTYLSVNTAHIFSGYAAAGEFTVRVAAAATVLNAYGVRSLIVRATSSSAAIANAYGYYAQWQNSVSGAAGTTYLYYAAESDGTDQPTTYAFYAASATHDNYFGGPTSFGSTVTLADDPVADLEAATKQYVDAVDLSDLNDVSIPTPEAQQVLTFDGSLWVPRDAPSTAAPALFTLYLEDIASGTAGYETLRSAPSGVPEEADSGTIAAVNTITPIAAYLSAELNRTRIDAGLWEFNTYGAVNQTIRPAYIVTDVFTRAIDGEETYLFSGTCGPYNTLTPVLLTDIITAGSYFVDPTDKLVAKYGGLRTAIPAAVTVTLYHSGSSHESHIHTPVSVAHNDLSGIQGGTTDQYYHLTSNQFDAVNLSDNPSANNAFATRSSAVHPAGDTMTGTLAALNVFYSTGTQLNTGTVILNYTGSGFTSVTLESDTFFTATNAAAGRSVTARMAASGGARALSFDADIVFLGDAPTSLADGKVAVLSLTAFGTDLADTVAAYAAQT